MPRARVMPQQGTSQRGESRNEPEIIPPNRRFGRPEGGSGIRVFVIGRGGRRTYFAKPGPLTALVAAIVLGVEGKTVDTSQGNVKRTPAAIAAPSAPAGHQRQGIRRGIEMGRSKYTFLYHSARNRKFADSPLERDRFEIPVPRQIGSGFEASVELGLIDRRRGGIIRTVVGPRANR